VSPPFDLVWAIVTGHVVAFGASLHAILSSLPE